MLDFYLKLKKDEKLAAGIWNANGRALIQQHMEELEWKHKLDLLQQEAEEKKRQEREKKAKEKVKAGFKNKAEIEREATLE